MTTRFRTRAFLICFIPFAVVLSGSFWMVQRLVEMTVRDGLRASLRENQVAIAGIHAKGDLENSRFLKVAGENSSLKAGMQLLLDHRGSESARSTVEDQLRELGEHMGFDLLLISGPSGDPLAGVVRQPGSDGRGQLVPMTPTLSGPARSGLLSLDGRTFQVASIPMDQDDRNLGALAVGEYFDISTFTTPAVLIRGKQTIESNIPAIGFDELNAALAGCKSGSECDLRIRNANWISLPMESYGDGYLLRSLVNVDDTVVPMQARLNRLFLSLTILCVGVALLCSLVASQSIVKPINAVVSHLRNAIRTGVLPEFTGDTSSISEVRDLAEIYNRAALSVKAAGEDLQGAYLEFVGSLANALDARDGYTSGHSLRVSQLSCAAAEAMQLDADHIERIRIGALLHDIGKIGIADGVLQKPGRLTEAEFALVKQHPVIGRRILEGVGGFAPYLPAVELHHENWDGTGYPKGQSGEETPIDARIIHVSDAYDAMTTYRSYRSGMSHEKAISILIEYAGRQFDPHIVDVFINLPIEVLTAPSAMARPALEAEEPELAVAG